MVGVLRHEMGHAFDDALVTPAGTVGSARTKFRKAYDLDKKDILAKGEEAKNNYSYYLQQGEAGKSEAFAEIFGHVTGGGSNSWTFKLTDWARTTKVVEELIKGVT